MPLNIFEPRYLAMVQDAMATPHRLIGMIQQRAMMAIMKLAALAALQNIQNLMMVACLSAWLASRALIVIAQPFKRQATLPVMLISRNSVKI